MLLARALRGRLWTWNRWQRLSSAATLAIARLRRQPRVYGVITARSHPDCGRVEARKRTAEWVLRRTRDRDASALSCQLRAERRCFAAARMARARAERRPRRFRYDRSVRGRQREWTPRCAERVRFDLAGSHF